MRDGTAEKGRTAKNYRSVPQNVPQKKDPAEPAVPQKISTDDIDDDDLEDGDFTDYGGAAGWRIEQRFYTKKDGTIMLYWNYRSREPVYINGERKIGYKPGGKKIWQQPPRKKKSTR